MELIVWVLECLAEDVGMRATARVFEVAPTTVLPGLVEAAEELRAFTSSFLCDLHVEQLQLDELYAVLRDLKAGKISDDEAMERLEWSPLWVWTAMDPQSTLLLVIDVGTPTLAMAQRVVHHVTQELAPGCVPLFLTDGFREYTTVLLSHGGYGMHPERRQDKGPLPQPRWRLLPALRYAQVVKSYRRRRLVGVKHRVVFGTPLAMEQLLAACGWTINTAFVERLHLDIRQRVAAIGRRVNPLDGLSVLLEETARRRLDTLPPEAVVAQIAALEAGELLALARHLRPRLVPDEEPSAPAVAERIVQRDATELPGTGAALAGAAYSTVERGAARLSLVLDRRLRMG